MIESTTTFDHQAAIEEYLRSHFAADNPLVTEAVRRMIAAGGKRVRPRIALLAAEAVGAPAGEHLEIAAYMELIHVATLIHDDVVDRADMRRGVNATAIDYGNRISVLAGDYLFAWIFRNVTARYPAPIPHILSATLAEICAGEVLQLRALGELELQVTDYLDIVAKKTASLFAASAECGAIVAGASPDDRAALRQYGYDYGVAFQIKDDLLDLTSNEARLGKPAGNDLRERKITIPLIFALQQANGEFRTAVERFFARGDDAQLERIVDGIRKSGALDKTGDQIDHYAQRASRSIAGINPGPARRALLEMAAALSETAER
ncbi:MAG: polyprenyl synthetase family protein [Candidatus Eremiobacteraeota bacterium]|nr:polyprenyl synthetase family protein [Candidatus Eremiobacteraeota bacterium]